MIDWTTIDAHGALVAYFSQRTRISGAASSFGYIGGEPEEATKGKGKPKVGNARMPSQPKPGEWFPALLAICTDGLSPAQREALRLKYCEFQRDDRGRAVTYTKQDFSLPPGWDAESYAAQSYAHENWVEPTHAEEFPQPRPAPPPPMVPGMPYQVPVELTAFQIGQRLGLKGTERAVSEGAAMLLKQAMQQVAENLAEFKAREKSAGGEGLLSGLRLRWKP